MNKLFKILIFIFFFIFKVQIYCVPDYDNIFFKGNQTFGASGSLYYSFPRNANDNHKYLYTNLNAAFGYFVINQFKLNFSLNYNYIYSEGGSFVFTDNHKIRTGSWHLHSNILGIEPGIYYYFNSNKIQPYLSYNINFSWNRKNFYGDTNENNISELLLIHNASIGILYKILNQIYFDFNINYSYNLYNYNNHRLRYGIGITKFIMNNKNVD